MAYPNQGYPQNPAANPYPTSAQPPANAGPQYGPPAGYQGQYPQPAGQYAQPMPQYQPTPGYPPPTGYPQSSGYPPAAGYPQQPYQQYPAVSSQQYPAGSSGYPPPVLPAATNVSKPNIDWGPVSVTTTCSNCNKNITTIVSREAGAGTWVCYSLLFFVVLCPLNFIPFFIDNCKDIRHMCPSCSTIVGRKDMC